LLSDVAFQLAERGRDIAVVTSQQTYEAADARLPARERTRGVDIWRVRTSERGRGELVGRSLDYLTFYLGAMWRVLSLARRGDVIVAKTDPPLLSVAIAPLAWIKGAKLVNWLQDVFPEVAAELEVGAGAGRAAFAGMKRLRNWSLRGACMNVVVGDGMAARLRAEGVPADRIMVIPNWSDGALISPLVARDTALRHEWAPDASFVVAYAGNLGRAHDIETIVKALALLRERARGGDSRAAGVVFVLVGGGAQRAEFEQEIARHGLTNVRLHPYQPRARLAETLGMADAHLVSLNPKLEGLIVPSKFYGIAAAGRPTIFIGAADGEIANILAELRCGMTIAPGNAEALVARVLELAGDPALRAELGTRARLAFEERWDRSTALARWDELFAAIEKEPA
jgi:glycosyltransferase involved in cell wall biosynthesis